MTRRWPWHCPEGREDGGGAVAGLPGSRSLPGNCGAFSAPPLSMATPARRAAASQLRLFRKVTPRGGGLHILRECEGDREGSTAPSRRWARRVPRVAELL